MADTAFRPVMYFKQGCPFCFKVRLFLLETGLTDKVKVREFTPGTPEEDVLRNDVAPYLAKVSFPAAQLEPGQFVADSDAIITFLADQADVEIAALPVLRAYVEGPFRQIGTLWQENQALKASAAA